MIRKLLLALAALVALAALLWVWRPGPLQDALADGPFRSTAGFQPYPLPIQHTVRLFDIGVVDANSDGWLDIFTANHHFRQSLLLADGKGGWRDVIADWGLDQSSEFPLAELNFLAPKPDAPGIYVYWYGTNLVVKAHQLAQTGPWRGSMSIYSGVKIAGREGFDAELHESREGDVVRTRVDFTPKGDGMLVLTPGSQGLPLNFRFEGSVQPAQIFVGLGRVPPKALNFSLANRDRHGMAWADFNGDGVLDVFITRGALGGTLRTFPAEVIAAVRDELLLSQGQGRFADAAAQLGIEKQGCSGRHAMWVDYDGDGLLDLFVNCYDRESIDGDYPKQLYRQSPAGVLRNVADEIGIGLAEQQMASLLWLDVDGDGQQDLLAHQEEGLILYRYGDGVFGREVVAPRPPGDERIVAVTRNAAWFHDGKLAAADYDRDGRIDVFSASKRGNVLLRSQGAGFEVVDLQRNGLPAVSTYAAWVDFDNDGRLDLHLFPQGLFRQTEAGAFERTGILETHPDRFRSAIVSWPDLDGDGRRDLLVALDENPDFEPWWRFGKASAPRSRWQVMALRNTRSTSHRWLQVDLRGGPGNPQGVGALVSVVGADAVQAQMVGGAEGSFFSQGHYRTYFGLGQGLRIEALRVRWPDGLEQSLPAPSPDQRIVVERPRSP